MTAPRWEPSRDRVERARLTAFLRTVEARRRSPLPDYAALHRFSVEEPEKFWTSVWDFCGVVAETRGDVVVETPATGDPLLGTRFFPQARLNFARNLLRRRDDSDAIVFEGEGGRRRRLSYSALYDEVSRLAAALRAHGLQPGDRVAAYLPNLPEAIVAVLATASLGAVWSSCSPDFGVQGVLDRFGQIRPRVLLAADGYVYNGKVHDRLTHLPPILEGLPSVERLVVVPYLSQTPAIDGFRDAVTWLGLLAQHPPEPIRFESLPFDHPLYVLYSSGTTGPPKCLVHGAGGTLIQHLKEHQLHCDIQAGDRVFYFTTLGWMMWNWLVTVLASEATIVLYDGAPFHPDGNILFDLADATGTTLFGTSAKFLDAVAKAELSPIDTHRLDSVRTITSTGSPLSPESFDFVYRHIKRDVHLASISGGTDIVACFVGGNPTAPVWRGEIQAKALGMRVEVFDEAGRSVRGEKGELVCTAPFPSMPLRFWNDPDGRKYHAAYFDTYPGVWRHGDYVELTDHDGMIIHGRSDAVLNPGGVRIGTAGDLSPGRAARRGPGEPGHRAGVGPRREGGALRPTAARRGVGRRIDRSHQDHHPPERDAAARASQDRAGGRHPAHQERQDRGAGRP